MCNYLPADPASSFKGIVARKIDLFNWRGPLAVTLSILFLMKGVVPMATDNLWRLHRICSRIRRNGCNFSCRHLCGSRFKYENPVAFQRALRDRENRLLPGLN